MGKTWAALVVGIFIGGTAWGYQRHISFSGYTWEVKDSTGKVGPGPNYFSSTTNNVWVDALGRLHLKLTKRQNRWSCAEVICTNSFGHGTYRFSLDSPVDNLDPNVVLGLFTWNDLPDYNHRELDIEFSRWGNARNQNAQYVVQPYDNALNIHRFQWPSGVAQSIHGFLWQPTSVLFQSGTATGPMQEWTGTHDVPVPGGENPRINLWLFRGRAPANKQELELIINRFEFVPAP